jgi:hypothetical protein
LMDASETNCQSKMQSFYFRTGKNKAEAVPTIPKTVYKIVTWSIGLFFIFKLGSLVRPDGGHMKRREGCLHVALLVLSALLGRRRRGATVSRDRGRRLTGTRTRSRSRTSRRSHRRQAHARRMSRDYIRVIVTARRRDLARSRSRGVDRITRAVVVVIIFTARWCHNTLLRIRRRRRRRLARGRRRTRNR